MSSLGTVQSIDRVNQIVNVFIDPGTIPTPCRYLGDPPPPLSRVAVDSPVPGQWICRGAGVDSRLILHDDFLAAAGGAIPGGTGYGDTPWTSHGTAGALGQSPITGAGVVQVATPSNTLQFLSISKDNDSIIVPASPAGLWFSGRMAVRTLANGSGNVGLGDEAATGGVTNNKVTCSYDSAVSATNWFMLTQHAGGAVTNTITPVAVVLQTMTDFDLVLVGGQFCAIWINGAGPNVVTNASIAAVGDHVTPYISAACHLNTGNIITDVDYVHLERVASVQDPTKPPFVQVPAH